MSYRKGDVAGTVKKIQNKFEPCFMVWRLVMWPDDKRLGWMIVKSLLVPQADRRRSDLSCHASNGELRLN